MQLNHYPIRRDLTLSRSDYGHRDPIRLATALRHQGLDATEHAGRVRVYHGAAQPPVRAALLERVPLTLEGDWEEYRRALRAFLGELFLRQDFVRWGREGVYVARRGTSLRVREKTQPRFAVHAHAAWSWDVEVHGDQLWLVPLPGRRLLSAQPLSSESVLAWARERQAAAKPTNVIGLQSGWHGRVAWEQDTPILRGRHAPSLQDVHATLDMREMKLLGYSGAAYESAQLSFHTACQEVRACAALQGVLAACEPLQGLEDRVWRVGGEHLQFGRRRGAKPSDVFQRGLLEAPPQVVRLLPVIRRAQYKRDSEVYHNLRQQILPTETLLQLEVPPPRADTLYTTWTGRRAGERDVPKLGLPPFRVHPKPLVYQPDGSVGNPEVLEEALAAAWEADERVVGLLLSPNTDLRQEVHNTLHANFRGKLSVVEVREGLFDARASSSDMERFSKWANTALAIARKAGGQGWTLAELPGACERTVFLGLDLGHHHAEQYSKLAVGAFDARGQCLDRRVFKLDALNERMPTHLLTEKIPRWLDGVVHKRGLKLERLIVHRDGRYLPGEVVDLQVGFGPVERLYFVCVKKDALSRLSGEELDGAACLLDGARALLVTNIQAQGGSMPQPLEIEVGLGLSLQDAVAQVFWLSRMDLDNAFQPPRLPVTTRRANNIAGTGKKVHLKRLEGSA